ncbi:MAG TPA: response regulator [Kofleriaceae bacterium]|nr:response regulator [Kofleriaceae bacterium]
MSNVSILVVDDDDEVRASLVDELSRDYQVEAAACGEEAFAALAARRYDVVISDLKMPDHDGIEVLDFAQVQQAGIIRILLTGYVDDRAHRRLLEPDAPYKVGKPWYDEIDVVLRRALEQRHRQSRLSSSLAVAMNLAQLEASLSSAASLAELGELLVLHGASIAGVAAITATLDGQRLAGAPEIPAGVGWRLETSVDGDHRLRLQAGGDGDEARTLLEHLLHLGGRRSGVVVAEPRSTAAVPAGGRSRVAELMRQATIGAMTGALLHDLASIIQLFDVAMQEVLTIVESRPDPDLQAAADDVATAGREAIDLFLAMRRMMREGSPGAQAVTAAHVVHRVVRMAGGAVRERAALRVPPVPPIELVVAETVLVQALVNLLGHAAASSPAGGTVDLDVEPTADRIRFVITDDGDAPTPAAVALLFEPMAWNQPDQADPGLAIAAHVISALGGTLSFRHAPGRGSQYIVDLPRTAPNAGAAGSSPSLRPPAA